ncbi:MAG: hypothetical protein ABS939_06185 [Psychrobacillus sp.]
MKEVLKEAKEIASQADQATILSASTSEKIESNLIQSTVEETADSLTLLASRTKEIVNC